MVRLLPARGFEDRATLRRTVLAALGALLLTALAAAGAPGARAATTGPSFALEPVGATGARSYFVLRARPGQTITRQVRVTNVGHRAGGVLLYAVDATTGQTTGAVYQAAAAPRRDVGAWTRIGRGALRLAPGQARTVTVRVRVPRGVVPGTHLGGIVAENRTVRGGKRARHGRGSFRIKVRNLTILALQLELPGPREARMALTGEVSAGGSAGGHQAVLVGLRNAGNVLLKPRLSLLLRDGGGGVVQKTRLKLDTFVPRTQILYPVPVRGRALRTGHYTAELVVDDGRGHVTRARTPFEISPKEVKQVFGASSPLAQPSGGGSSLGSYLPWVLVAVLGGATAFLVLRQRRGGAGRPARES